MPTEDYAELAQSIANLYAVELGASNTAYKFDQTLDDFDNGEQVQQLLPDYPTPEAENEHANICADKLGLIDYNVDQDVMVWETLRDFEQAASQIEPEDYDENDNEEPYLRNITGFFKLVEDQAFGAARNVRDTVEATDKAYWARTFEEIMEDEEDDANKFQGRLERQHGMDDTSYEAIEEMIGTTFDPSGATLRQ